MGLGRRSLKVLSTFAVISSLTVGFVTTSSSAADGWSSLVSIESSGTGLVSVSCASPTFCVALDGSGTALIYNGTAWSSPTTIDSGGLSSVSCPTSNFCAAVGGNDAVIFNGSSWSGPVNIDQYYLQSVSCTSSSYCVAVDSSGDVLTFNGGAWSVSTGQAPLLMYSVSCPSTGLCWAVDGFGSALSGGGGVWATHSVLIKQNDEFNAVSCPSASFCVTGSLYGEVSYYNGTSWSPVTSIDPGGDLISVSCPTSNFCAATGLQGTHQLFTYDGTSWSPANGTDPYGSLNAVSCPSASFCVAVDSIGQAMFYGPLATTTTTTTTTTATTTTTTPTTTTTTTTTLAPSERPTLSVRATPKIVAAKGGRVTLYVTVRGATSCQITSSPPIAGIGGHVSCSNGTFKRSGDLRRNLGATRTVHLSVVASNATGKVKATVTIRQL